MHYKNPYTKSKNQKLKRIKQNKNHKKREKQKIIKNELIVLRKVDKLPDELIDYIYSFVNNSVKLYISHYFDLYKKYIINYKYNNINCIYKGYDDFEYYTYDKLSIPLQNMLKSIPLDILRKYILYGTPKVYFTKAFPFENNIHDYIHENYNKHNKRNEETYKDYIFEIIDILSYFVTKVKNNYLYKNYTSVEYNIFKENEYIVKKYILSILYIYEKYAIV